MTPHSNRVIRQYYGFQFFFSLLLWLPIFYEFQQRIGLNNNQIFSIQSIYYLVFCLLEIPTGLMADHWGYRRCMRMGAVTLVICNLFPIFMQNYAGFLIHFLLIALARSFISGASSAYIYEYMHSIGRIQDYKQIEGKARGYGLVGKVVCWSVIGVLMQWHLTLPYWLTVGSAAISVFYALRLPEITAAPQPASTRAHSHFEVAEILLRSPALVLIILQGIAIFVLARICQVNLFQPILGSKSFSIASYGLIMSATTVFEAIGSFRPAFIRKHMTDLNAVFALTVIMAVSLALIPYADKTGTLALLGVFSLATGFSFPIQRQLLNDYILDSSHRATLLSIESIVDRAVCAAIAPVIGVFLAQDQLGTFLVLSAIVTLVLMGILIFALKLRPKTMQEQTMEYQKT